MQGLDKIEKLSQALAIATEAIARGDFELCKQALSEADELKVSIASALFSKSEEVDQRLWPVFSVLLNLFSLLTGNIIHYRHWRWWYGLTDLAETCPDYAVATVQDVRVGVSRNCGTVLHIQGLHCGRPYTDIRLALYDSAHCRRVAEEFRVAADALDATAADRERLLIASGRREPAAVSRR